MADARKKPGGLPGSIRQIAGRLPAQMSMRRSSKRETPTEPAATAASAAVARQPKQRTKPLNIEKIFAEMNGNYYKEDFDTSRHVLESLDQLDQPGIEVYRSNKYKELQAVSTRLSELVTKNKGEFLRELERVTTLEQDLTRSTALCKAERKHIAHAEMSVKRDLAILYKYRKKTRMDALLQCAEALLTYKTARENIERKLEQPKDAVDIWLSLNAKAELFEQFTCVSAEAADYIKDQRAVIEERLERTLKLQCSSSYQQEKYLNVIAAYKALDMYADAIDRVQYNFAVVVPTLVRNTITKILGNAEELRAMSFKELLRRVPLSLFEDCLVEVCRAVCRIMLIFSRIFNQHKRELRAATQGDGPSTPGQGHRRTRSLTTAWDTDSVVSTGALRSESSAQIAAPGLADASLAPNGAPPAAAGAFAPQAAVPPGTPLMRADSADLNSSFNITAPLVAAPAPVDPISKKFESTRERIWLDVQKQVVLMLSSQDIATLKLNVFLRVLSHIRRLSEIGEDFSKMSSPLLNEATRTRTLSYVLGHHRRTLERGKSFLEQDSWLAETVPVNFNFLKLKEFAFLRKKKDLTRTNSTTSMVDVALAAAAAAVGGPTAALAAASAGLAGAGAAGAPSEVSAPVPTKRERAPSALERFQQDQDMFHTARNAPEDTDALPELDESDQAAVDASAVDKVGEKAPTRVHCSRSSLYFVRCIGRYMHMMDVLKPIAGEVFACLKELFDYYTFTVITYFGDKAYLNLLEPKPRQLFNRLEATIPDKPRRDSVPALVPTLPPGVTSASSSQLAADRLVMESGAALLEIGLPRINPDVADQLSSMPALLGLPRRITGAESMMFLATAMRSLSKYLKERIAEEPIKAYFALTVEQVVILKWYIYKCNALKIFSKSLTDLASEMEHKRWDIKEIRSEHSSYIENLDRTLGTVKSRFSSFTESMVPQMAANMIWTEILTQVNATLIDGFAMARKCTNEGRALMQLDYRQLLLKIRGYTNARCQAELVEDYIRAYYLSDEELLTWIEEHYKVYSAKQLYSLVNVGTSPRNKQALQQRIGELKGEPQPKQQLLKQFL